MIKNLEDALGTVLRLLEHKLADAAELPERLAQIEAARYALSTDERMVVCEALARATQGNFANEADVDGTLRRPWN